jgi:hypothetical protein
MMANYISFHLLKSKYYKSKYLNTIPKTTKEDICWFLHGCMPLVWLRRYRFTIKTASLWLRINDGQFCISRWHPDHFLAKVPKPICWWNNALTADEAMTYYYWSCHHRRMFRCHPLNYSFVCRRYNVMTGSWLCRL